MCCFKPLKKIKLLKLMNLWVSKKTQPSTSHFTGQDGLVFAKISVASNSYMLALTACLLQVGSAYGR
jgi:hypothetical protein